MFDSNIDTALEGASISGAPSAQDTQLEIIGELTKRKAKGDRINGHEVIGFLTPDDNNFLVRDWLAQNNVMTRGAFDRAFAARQKRCRVERQLGFFPENVFEFVAKYVERERISLSYNGLLSQDRMPVWEGQTISEANRADAMVDNIARLISSEKPTLGELRQELRLLAADLGLGFSDVNIEDATQKWAREQRRSAKIDIYSRIAFSKGQATGPEGQRQWDELERAAFDVTETCQRFAIAVIQKFMWQVKRKMLGLEVTNHLMPVLTGAQGKGKSTLVHQLLQPVRDCVSHSDFKQITDDRNIDLWNSYVIFMDEMGHAKRAEIEDVKSIITTKALTRRPMRSNSVEHVEQRATFIGCCNKGLSELVKDETGVRRFAELTFTNTPDWASINTLDWKMLWQSVDERGPDPCGAIAEVLRKQQAGNRSITAVEEWARQAPRVGRSRASELHQEFREWEQAHFPRNATDLASWRKEMKRLTQDPEFPWTTGRDSQGMWYSNSPVV